MHQKDVIMSVIATNHDSLRVSIFDMKRLIMKQKMSHPKNPRASDSEMTDAAFWYLMLTFNRRGTELQLARLHEPV